MEPVSERKVLAASRRSGRLEDRKRKHSQESQDVSSSPPRKISKATRIKHLRSNKQPFNDAQAVTQPEPKEYLPRTGTGKKIRAVTGNTKRRPMKRTRVETLEFAMPDAKRNRTSYRNSPRRNEAELLDRDDAVENLVSESRSTNVKAPTDVETGNSVMEILQNCNIERLSRLSKPGEITLGSLILEFSKGYIPQKHEKLQDSNQESAAVPVVEVTNSTKVAELHVEEQIEQSSIPLKESKQNNKLSVPLRKNSSNKEVLMLNPITSVAVEERLSNHADKENVAPAYCHSYNQNVNARDMKQQEVLEPQTALPNHHEQQDVANTRLPIVNRELLRETTLIAYPEKGSKSVPQITVTLDDMKHLSPKMMLNDSIVEFYLKFIQYNLVDEERRDSIHVFNTFLYSNITRANGKSSDIVFNDGQEAGESRYEWIKENYSKVRSWTRRVNIFEKDIIVIPVNDRMHWYVVIIVNPKNAIAPQREENAAETRQKGAKGPITDSYVIVLDSLMDVDDIQRQCTVDIIRDYLELEFENKKMSGTINRRRLSPLILSEVPQQSNTYDCGVFLLEFVEKFLTKPPKISPTEPNSWTQWYADTAKKVLHKRREIANTIEELAGNQRWSCLKEYERKVGKGITLNL